jgi:hypothetical protein
MCCIPESIITKINKVNELFAVLYIYLIDEDYQFVVLVSLSASKRCRENSPLQKWLILMVKKQALSSILGVQRRKSWAKEPIVQSILVPLVATKTGCINEPHYYLCSWLKLLDC